MDREQFIAYAATHPDHLQELAQPLIDAAVAAAKPKLATSAELKAAFPDDKDFVIDRLEIDAPLGEHKVAYADHLKTKLAFAGKARDELTKQIAAIDPAQVIS